MSHNESEVLILKPTRVLLSFLAEQFPHLELPGFSALKIDNTAYSIPKQPNDEATLDEIERHFPTMFRHEIARLLGHEAACQVSGSFLDFLCCFKFELHSQILLMESDFQEGQQLLCIKPRSVLLKWMKSTLSDQLDFNEVIDQINLSHLTDNATVLVKRFQHLSEVAPFVQHYYRPLYKAEMYRMSDKADQWPEVDSYQAFDRYFSVELHSQLVHLN